MRALPSPDLAYDGPIPPADLAAARWGGGALDRLGRGADAALAEARLRGTRETLAAKRRALAGPAELAALAGRVGAYRAWALVALRRA
jgi:hypothetical protein